MNAILQDARYALRRFRKDPGFTLLAVLILALGIGANTAIFSAVYAVLLRPLPFKDAGRLVFVRKQNPPRGWTRNPISPPEVLAWRDQSGAFEDMAAITDRSCVLTGTQETEADSCQVISSNLFSVLGVSPFRGRAFTKDEDKAEAARVALLSYGFWRRRFGGDESVIGRSIDVNGSSYTIAGVVPGRMGNEHPSIAPYAPFPTAEGELVVAVGNERQFSALCEVIGAPELASDPRFDTNSGRVDNRRELDEQLQARLAARPASEWARLLTEARVPAGVVNDVRGAFALAQTLGLAPTVSIPRDDGSAVLLTRNPVALSRTPPSYRSAPPSLPSA